MKKTKILFIPQAGRKMAGSRTRVFQYLPFFDKENIPYSVKVWSEGCALHRLKILLLSLFHNVIFIQKFLMRPQVLTLFKLLGKKIVFDFDDAIYVNKKTGEDSSHHWDIDHQLLHRHFETSSLIVLESKTNEEYVISNTKQRNILRIVGPIDTDLYHPADDAGHDGTVTIGWVGSPPTTQYLTAMNPVYKALEDKYGNRLAFKCIGADESQITGTAFEGGNVKWDQKTEPEELRTYDIGIMPLPDDPWTRGKGGYKLLQYMAVGIPSVCSPVGTNTEIIREGINGFTADTEQAWIEKLSLLIENRYMRIEMGKRGREIAVSEYSFHHYAPILIGAIRNTVD